MAQKISLMTPAASLTGAEYWEMLQAGQNVRVSPGQLSTYLQAIGIDTVSLRNAAIAALKDGVPTAGDTLNKLYNLVINTGVTRGTYNDIADLLGDQSAQVTGCWYLVQDASADPTVDSGWAIYMYLGTTGAALSDYWKVLEEEGLDMIVNDASETTKGIAEIATQGETNAAADDSRFVTPLKLKVFTDGNYVGLTGNQTITGQKTFTASVGSATVALFLNTTAAVNGVQQNSPFFAQRGSGFALTPNIPQTVEVRHQVRPIQGSANASLTYAIDYDVANGAVTSNLMTLGPGAATLPGQLFIGQTAPYGWTGRATMYATGVGVIMFANNAGTDVNRVQWGGISNLFPSMKRNGAGLDLRLADDSGYTLLTGRFAATQDGTNDGLNVGGLNGDPSGTTNGGIWYNTSTNQMKARINTSSIVLSGAINSDVVVNRVPFYATTSGRLSTSANVTWDGSTFRADSFLAASNVAAGGAGSLSFNGRTVITCPSNGTLLIYNSSGTDFIRAMLGGITNSFPSIKRNGAGIDIRLADDSNYAALASGALTVVGNVSLGTASFTGTDRSITAISSTANCNVIIAPQGSGSTVLRYDGGGAYFKLGTPIDSGTTRNITVDGSASDISFGVVSKGNGGINLSSGAGTGYIQLISQSKVYRFGDVANLGAAIELPTLTTSSDITLTNSHFMVGVDTTVANRIVTLPPADSCPGRMYAIQKIDNSINTLQIAAAVGDSIEGSSTRNIGVQWACSILISDGSITWRRLSNT